MRRLLFKNKYLLIFSILLSSFFISIPHQSEAATLRIFPTESIVLEGQDYSQVIFLSTDDSANAVSGVIDFPNDIVEVVSVDLDDSIVDFWVAKPSFSNTEGKIRFEGVMLNPGYEGSVGEVFSINWKARASGDGNLSFQSGSVLANDGRGTNIIEGFSDSFVRVQGDKISSQSSAIPESRQNSVYSLTIKEIESNDYTEPKRTFDFKIERGSPTIDFYEIRIDGGDYEVWVDENGGRYTTPVLLPGTHILTVTAVDKKGQILTDSEVFIVEPLPGLRLSNLPSKVYLSGSSFFCNLLENILFTGRSCGDAFIVEGKAIPNSEVVLKIVDEGRGDEAEYSVRASSNGFFSIPLESQLGGGQYALFAYAQDERGARTESERIANVSVENPTAVSYGGVALTYIIVLALIIGIIVAIWRAYHRYIIKRMRLQREIFEAETILKERFEGIERSVDELRSTAKMLRQKGSLSKDEEELLNRLEEEIKQSESDIEKELRDIDRFDSEGS